MATISGTVTFTAAELAALAKQVAPLIPSVALPPPVVTPPTTTPPAGVLWIFNGGTRNSAGDYSYGSGKVTYGKTVLVTGDEGWQPRMPNDDLDTTGYNWVLVSIMPTQKHTWISGMEMIGDVPIPGNHGPVDITPYGPKTVVLNQWNDFKIPISLYGNLPGLHVYKIMWQPQQVPNPSGNSIQYDKLGFAP